MRTQADLEAAFVLIEASVDEYCEQAELEPGSARVIDLVSDRPRPTARRTTSVRRALSLVGGAAVAASAAALVVALVGPGSSGSSRDRPAGSGLAALGSSGRSLPFTIAQSTGLQVLGVESTATGRTVELASESVHLSVWIGEPDRDVHVSPGLETVTIGQQSGYYDDGSLPALTQGSSAPPPTSSSNEIPGTVAEPAVVWEYAPTAFAVVTGFDPDSPPSRAALLSAARGLQLTDTVPLKLSFRLTRAQALGSLTRIITTSQSTKESSAPYTVTSAATLCEASYGLAATGNGVGITVYSSTQGGVGADGGSGVEVVVDGHQARWDVHFHQLVVDLGRNVHVRIVEENFTGRYTLSLRDYDEFFRLVTVVPDVTDRATWIDAQDALP